MNLLKRAWWRLAAHVGKTLMLVGLFFVICTLVLSGFLIQSAAARAADMAKKQVGAVATMQLDVNALVGSSGTGDSERQQPGLIGTAGKLKRSLVDEICTSPVVEKCSYSTDSGAFPTDATKLHQPVPPPAGANGADLDMFSAPGVLDLDEVGDFRNGDSTLVSGRGITPDSKSDEIVVEERMAKKNALKVGDTVELMVGALPMPGEKRNTTKHSFTVVGVYRNSTPDSERYVPAVMDPANRLYVTPDGGSLLNAQDGKETVLQSATFILNDPDDLDRLKKDAAAAGADPEIFPLTINDKQYKTLVGPITKTADFAGVTVWLVAVAGTAILALTVASSLRERRKELGILLSLGESKPRLLGQHLAEVTACAVLAVGAAGACSQFLSQAVGDVLLTQEVASAEESAERQYDHGGPGGGPGGGMRLIEPGPQDDQPEVDPISSMDVRLGPTDIAKVGATGLGIAALATLVPGIRVLRLNPRDILTKGE
ncbi:FtsX-like permease family protein [Streptomyces cyaneofuscatus]|uniref:FtsX-like permease family protein n=1 Tax=Streptomyces cyaneofuscatus TaxID=66883 RepID=UPI003674CE6F